MGYFNGSEPLSVNDCRIDIESKKMFNTTEQHLVNQANQIRKKGRLAKVELKWIKWKVQNGQ